MSEAEVENLLGTPGKINANEYFFMWYYDYPGGGSVKFDSKTRALKEWGEP
jgi:hypothetical protein